jgi:hypothetical protein
MFVSSRRAGVAVITGALLEFAGNSVVHSSSPAVATDRVSYPLSVHAFQLGQVFFAITQVLIAVGIVALVRSDAVAPGLAARSFGWIAVVGIALTVPGELLLIAVAGSDVDGAAASTVSTGYGIAILLTDIGLIGYGALALRQRRWPAGWRLLPLVFGLFQLLVVTPVSLAAGFASGASYVVIALSDVLLVAIGLALVRRSVAPEPLATAG